MVDLNHGSGFQYERPNRPPGIGIALNAAIDAALIEHHRAEPPRHYVSTSGLGRECLRQIQYDYLAVPKDEGREFEPNTLRIFQAGHRAEDLVAAWLRAAGFDLRTARSDGRQFGFSALDGRFRGHIDGCLVSGPVAMDYPALWENKALGAAPWKEVVKRGVVLAKPIYAAQIALYQAYLELPNPALFTALNRDTFELHCELVSFDAGLAQRSSDRAVQVVRASEAEELLPRAVADRTSAVCRGGRSAGEWHPACAWQDRCWRAAPNVNYANSADGKRKGKNRPILNDALGESFGALLYDACVNILVVTKGAVYICMSSSELDVLQKAFREAGGHWSTFVIWAKNTFTLGRSDYQRQYEPILYGWKDGADHYWCGARDQGDVWFIDKPAKNDLHPTMKPVELVERAIRNSSKSRDIVLDLFGGSGTTLIAAERSGRRARIVELDPKYVDVIVQRWQKATGDSATHAATGQAFLQRP